MKTRTRALGRASALLTATIAALALGAPAAAAARPPRFAVKTNPYTVGQAATWLDDTNVVYHADVPGDDVQIFRSTLTGRKRRCLTCGLKGLNEVPVPQPKGRWILFHSWNGHAVRVGAPGFGGIGSDIWVMTRDGRRRTNLTTSAELADNFHAYWSPDGRYIVWTALNWNSSTGGTGKSDVRVARFDPDGPHGPRLVGEHVVRPGNGHWYETQWWAPDGSGFLYTETYDHAINPELFFCRLASPARGACRPQRLTRNAAWDEQAVFTPDMKRILFMSSRTLPGAFNDWSIVSRILDLPARYDFALVLKVFSQSFLQPNLQQATDLWEMTLRWNRRHTRFRQRGRLRRLTTSGRDGWIIPEFAWDPPGRRLLWTQNKLDPQIRQVDFVRGLRRDIIRRLARIDDVTELGAPLSQVLAKIRTDAMRLLDDPSRAENGPPRAGGRLTVGKLAERTRIGRYVPAAR
jgi:WD40 repeat protein